MGAQRFPSLAETGFKEAVDRVAVVWPLVASHALRIAHGEPPEEGGQCTPSNGMAKVGLNLLTETARCVFVAGRAGKRGVACIHGSFSVKPLPDGKHSKRHDPESHTKADQIREVLPFS